VLRRCNHGYMLTEQGHPAPIQTYTLDRGRDGGLLERGAEGIGELTRIAVGRMSAQRQDVAEVQLSGGNT
jgi:hypothetical protein